MTLVTKQLIRKGLTKFGINDLMRMGKGAGWKRKTKTQFEEVKFVK